MNKHTPLSTLSAVSLAEDFSPLSCYKKAFKHLALAVYGLGRLLAFSRCLLSFPAVIPFAQTPVHIFSAAQTSKSPSCVCVW